MRHTHGMIEVVCGSMFSGKTDELIRRLVRATIAKQKVQVFKPAIDVRYAVEKVASHTGSTFDAIPVEIVYARWADGELVHQLLTAGHRVAVCRLQQDVLPDPLTNIPSLEQLPLIRNQTGGKTIFAST